ncbi:nitric oxide synthase oxygenase [Paenibacillus sp. S3N08]|uniref:Nitric oxide synthase oxygenase n=1 Tax=Paenibacillus agricola TaxID=2716264 RepID=A0ABX0JGI6_9BACL|nr:nitric oxide synthase oxygenase [Paenibacillus agricola]
MYTAAPFKGWYMGTEIVARNFAARNAIITPNFIYQDKPNHEKID